MEGLNSRFNANYATSQSALVGIDTLQATVPSILARVKYAIDPGLGVSADESEYQGAAQAAAEPQARSANGQYEEVVPFDGKIERPLLTMHGTGDLFVPVVIEQGLNGRSPASVR